jgi:hypothetical protein
MFNTRMLETLARELTPVLREIIRKALAEHGSVVPRYLSLDVAAKYMSTTPGSVRGMLRAKHFPQSKIGERVFIDVKDIDRAMKKGKGWANDGKHSSGRTSPKVKEISVA